MANRQYISFLVSMAIIVIVCTVYIVISTPKIAYIDSDKIFERYQKTADLRAELEKQKMLWNQQLTEYELLSKNMMEKGGKQDTKKLEQLSASYNNLADSLFGKDGIVEKKDRELANEIIDDINANITSRLKISKYDIVLDAAKGGIVSGAAKYDLTEDVIASLNTAYANSDKKVK